MESEVKRQCEIEYIDKNDIIIDTKEKLTYYNKISNYNLHIRVEYTDKDWELLNFLRFTVGQIPGTEILKSNCAYSTLYSLGLITLEEYFNETLIGQADKNGQGRSYIDIGKKVCETIQNKESSMMNTSTFRLNSTVFAICINISLFQSHLEDVKQLLIKILPQEKATILKYASFNKDKPSAHIVMLYRTKKDTFILWDYQQQYYVYLEDFFDTIVLQSSNQVFEDVNTKKTYKGYNYINKESEIDLLYFILYLSPEEQNLYDGPPIEITNSDEWLVFSKTIYEYETDKTTKEKVKKLLHEDNVLEEGNVLKKYCIVKSALCENSLEEYLAPFFEEENILAYNELVIKVAQALGKPPKDIHAKTAKYGSKGYYNKIIPQMKTFISNFLRQIFHEMDVDEEVNKSKMNIESEVTLQFRPSKFKIVTTTVTSGIPPAAMPPVTSAVTEASAVASQMNVTLFEPTGNDKEKVMLRINTDKNTHKLIITTIPLGIPIDIYETVLQKIPLEGGSTLNITTIQVKKNSQWLTIPRGTQTFTATAGGKRKLKRKFKRNYQKTKRQKNKRRQKQTKRRRHNSR